VSEEFTVVEVAFCGDTLADVIDREPLVREAKLLVLECTFAGEDVDVAAARRKGHVHLDEIAARADLFRNEAILLTHFSARHSAAEIVRRLDERLPPDLRRRVTPLLPR
jgi:ribonuclease Z